MSTCNQFLSSKQQTLNSFYSFTEGDNLPLYPLEIFLEISNVCDLKCAMCGIFSALDQNRFTYLKEEERGFFNGKHQSLEKLLEHALLVHCFGYGEPTIYPQFKEVIDYISQYNVLIDFFTNGMHLTEELCEFLVKKNVFRVYVSFSGVTKEDYENIYLGGNFETVLSNIKRLAQTKEKYHSVYPQIEINSLAFQHHVDNIINFIDLMADHGVNYISLKPIETSDTLPQLNPHIALMRPWKEGELLKQAKLRASQRNIYFDASHFIEVMIVNSEEEFNLKKHALLQKQETIIPITEFKQLSKTLKPFPSKIEAISTTYSDQDIESYLELREPNVHIEQPCFEPFKTFYVKRDGKVKPCCFSNKFENRFTTLGDINQIPAEEIWQGTLFQTVQKGILTNKYPLKICKYCLKEKSAPQHHGISGIVNAYNEWHNNLFQTGLEPALLKKLQHLPTNQKILSNRAIEKPLNRATVIFIKNNPSLHSFYGFNIDLPSLDSEIFNEEIEIHGWVLGKTSRVSSIEIITDDYYEENTLLGTTSLTEIRTDVADAFPNVSEALQSGFIIKVALDNLSPIARLKVIAVLENNERHLLSIIGIQHPQRIVGKLLNISLQPNLEVFCGCNIDLPVLQTKITDYDLEISGWALGKSSYIEAIEFREQHHQQRFQRVKLCFSRPDVEEIYPSMEFAEKSGFSAIINLLLLEPKTTIEVVAALQNGEKVVFATLDVQRLPLRTAYQPRIKPLFINSLGRSGTTWFMHLLAQHPAILTHKFYPYELPVIEYYLHNVFVKSLQAMPPEQVPFPDLDVNDLFVLNRYRMYNIQQDLLREWFRKHQVEKLAYFCQKQIDAYIEQLLKFQERIGERLENPIYFAEKLINPSRETEYLSRLIWELYPQGKEIILVRDFRDMFCSVLSFMKKRNLKICFGLDFRHAQTDKEYVEITKQRIDFIWNCWKTRQHKAHLVRYEDLIEKPLPILKGIFEYLNIDHDEQTLQMILQKASKRNEQMTDHLTSSTVDASLGRWKKDLNPELQKLCNEAFQPALQAFGYC